MIKAYGTYVIVKQETKSKVGAILLASKNSLNKGVVISAGQDQLINKTIYFNSYNGYHLEGQEDLLVIKQDDILAIEE